MAEWSREFGAPVWLPLADADFRMRSDFEIVEWEGSAEPLPGLQLVQAGGHFPGNSVLRWAEGAGGRGALFTGDTVSVAADRRWVSFMRSYPNMIPLGPTALDRLVAALAPLEYDRLYSSWWDKFVDAGAKGAVQRSAARYREAIRA
jgi:glyoxylase-like metal-dependent hydrolase (beta-lactamase superfamily II)